MMSKNRPFHGQQQPTRRALVAVGAAVLAGAVAPPAALAVARSANARDLSRVVCIGGAITEILYALGLADHIVAVDSTSLYPPAALKEKRDIGYMRAVSAEGVLSMRPSLILAMRDAGPPQALAQLAASPAPLVHVDATPTPAGLIGRVRMLAALFGVAGRGEALCARIRSGFAALGQWRKAHPAQKRVLFLLSMQGGRPVVAGSGTAADGAVVLAGGINVAKAISGYKPVSDEAIMAMAPDVVLVMDNAGPSIGDSVLDLPAFRLTPAGRRHAIIHMDGEYLLGLGPRTPIATLDLAKRLAAI